MTALAKRRNRTTIAMNNTNHATNMTVQQYDARTDKAKRTHNDCDDQPEHAIDMTVRRYDDRENDEPHNDCDDQPEHAIDITVRWYDDRTSDDPHKDSDENMHVT